MVAGGVIREVYARPGAVAAVNVVQLHGFAWIVHSRSKNVLVVSGRRLTRRPHEGCYFCLWDFGVMLGWGGGGGVGWGC